MKRSGSVTTGSVLAAVTASAVLLACGSGDGERDVRSDYSQICIDPETQQRVDDDDCEDDDHSHSTFLWYYLSSSHSAPPVGSKVSGGTTVKPISGTIARPPKSGGFGTTRVGGAGS